MKVRCLAILYASCVVMLDFFPDLYTCWKPRFPVLPMSSLVVSFCTTVLLIIMVFRTSRLELLLLCPKSQITVTCFDVLTMVSKLLHLHSTTVLLIMVFRTSRLELLLLCPESQITVTCFDVLMMVSKLFLPFDNHSQQCWARQSNDEKCDQSLYFYHVARVRSTSVLKGDITQNTRRRSKFKVLVLLVLWRLFEDRISITK